MWYY